MYFRNGSIGLINEANGNFTWIVPPRSQFIDSQVERSPDGVRETTYENGTIIKDEYPPPRPEASEADKIWAVNKIIIFPNGTSVFYFVNGTVAVNEEGVFTRYIVPPKSFYVHVEISNYDDGSYLKTFSNGT